YDVQNKKLVVNEPEAETVRATFQLYVDVGSLLETARELAHRGVRSKTWTNQLGRRVSGEPFSKGSLSTLLTNPAYVGKVRAGDELVVGAHEAIVEQGLWAAVQERLKHNRRTLGSEQRNKWGALLRGLATCGRCGSAMRHHFNRKDGRVYRYYV